MPARLDPTGHAWAAATKARAWVSGLATSSDQLIVLRQPNVNMHTASGADIVFAVSVLIYGDPALLALRLNRIHSTLGAPCLFSFSL